MLKYQSITDVNRVSGFVLEVDFVSDINEYGRISVQSKLSCHLLPVKLFYDPRPV